MDEDAIIRYVSETFTGVDVVRPGPDAEPAIARGDTFFIYDPERNLPPQKQFPFATIVTKDYGDFDRASNLDRPGVFRLNVGVGKETYRALFGESAGHDFTALDRLMPHPVYGPQHWVSILNPAEETFREHVRPLLDEAYQIAANRHTRREARA
ncbi:MAG TPA: DUF6194 family protein [Longimicrobiaceae bacterium]|nr:DUF6194 family protein [Longimicrobiaceae bacterium]